MARKPKEVMDESLMVFLPEVSDEYTIDVAQEEIYEAASEGKKDHRCPCCNQKTVVYKVRPDPSSLAALVEVVAEYKRTRDWVDLTGKIKGSVGNFLLWVHWGFIDISDELHREGRHKWAKAPRLVKPTVEAYNWLNGTSEVSTHIYLYDKKYVGATTRTMAFKDLANRKYLILKKKVDGIPQAIRQPTLKPKLKLKPKVS